ncbi:MAG: hypothetical protein ACRC5C_09795, partial [Bacilli bacterium]
MESIVAKSQCTALSHSQAFSLLRRIGSRIACVRCMIEMKKTIKEIRFPYQTSTYSFKFEAFENEALFFRFL